MLRAAVNFHCLTVVRSVSGGEPRFRNNAMSSLLREDHPNSLKAIVRPCSAGLQQCNAECFGSCSDPLKLHALSACALPACR